MILKRLKTLPDNGKTHITKHVYSFDGVKTIFILGVYTTDTAKFYYCDRQGKKHNNKTLKLRFEFN